MALSAMETRLEGFTSAALEDLPDAGSRLDDAQCHAARIAGLTGLALDPDRLERELAAVLGQGCAPALAEDTIVQMAAYVGFPRARQALACLARVMSDHAITEHDAVSDRGAGAVPDSGAEARYRRGIDDYQRLNPNALANIQAAFGELAGRFVACTFRAFGDVYALSAQPLALRQCATIACLGTLGCAAPQLRFHMSAGLNVGLSREHIVEIIAWIQVLAGAPAAYNALTELKAALTAGAAATPGYQ